MSLKPSPIEPVPEQTARIARAAFPRGNPLLRLRERLRDELGPIFADADFADLFPKRGQPGLPPWRLALVTPLQFRENLPDRHAAEAVRARINWKYLLGLELTDPGFTHEKPQAERDERLRSRASSPARRGASALEPQRVFAEQTELPKRSHALALLTDPGFDRSVLSEFRARLLQGGAEERLLERLLERCQALGLLKARGRQRTDATHVLDLLRWLAVGALPDRAVLVRPRGRRPDG